MHRNLEFISKLFDSGILQVKEKQHSVPTQKVLIIWTLTYLIWQSSHKKVNMKYKREKKEEKIRFTENTLL